MQGALGGQAAAAVPADNDVAIAVKTLLERGEAAAARERFAELVERHQRRASRIAYHYLRDFADVDEAVQDAFFKAFANIRSFREEFPFEVWLTRILVNGCLDRLKARNRRQRWMVASTSGPDGQVAAVDGTTPESASPESLLLRRESSAQVLAAVSRLPDRQRSVVVLSLIDGRPAREVGAAMGLSESTVRVHLFRALKKLRSVLERG